MRDTDFKVGDKVRIRSWEDMTKEYGTTWNGIDTPGWSFVDSMKELCGTEFTITKLEEYASATQVTGLKFNGRKWIITTDMIEKVTSPAYVNDIKTFDEALDILVAIKSCVMNSTCDVCFVNRYREIGKAICNCYSVKRRAEYFLKNLKEPDPEPTPKKRTSKSKKTESHTIKCCECDFHRIVGDFCFCNHWHNFTTKDGFCHNSKPLTKTKKEK